ncbi:c-type cytochrome [Aliiroseovarius lamellibrachiae]|uniref:c-type cytochrome n=1 Tax=Aliiroseovarius lamellibrachiae TaxID=1924933 RepID=UPI001BDFACF6|nr:c-type cytochrome [Aliiroseovarius lamellibrachiae]MBT2132659.1 c-type cytochrome [Aliiroseovarius lamellibrachiae]
MKTVLQASATGLLLTLFMAPSVMAQDQGSIARGGRLYDKWYKVIKADVPTESHKLYPAANEKYADNPGANWRCKECHGWDGMGVEGAYASGSHSTGIKGINGMAGGDPAAVIAVLTGDAHGYGDKLSEDDLADLANFVTAGQIDMDVYIDRATKAPKGDAAQGEQVYNTICANCHAVDGMLPKDMPPLGSLMGNPWEIMHKVLNGQPSERMPALRAVDHQVAADVLAYLATLPKE